jgi:hypothetical protein
MFKNPPGDFAGRLIEQAGLKGARIGGARISEIHANFMLNDGSARASDVTGLVELVRGKVRGGTSSSTGVIPVIARTRSRISSRSRPRPSSSEIRQWTRTAGVSSPDGPVIATKSPSLILRST